MAVLKGPSGPRRSVPATGLTIAKAKPGLYRLTLAPTRITRANGPIKRGAIATALEETVSVHVVAGRHSLLKGSYTSVVNPGLKLLTSSAISITGPAEDPSSIILDGHVALGRGNVLSLPPSPMLPRGVLSNVTRVSYGPNTTSVSLTDASIYQVAPNFEFNVPLEVKEAPTATAASLGASCDPTSGLSPYRHIKDVSFSGGWSTADVFGVHITDGVRASVHFTTEAGLDVTAGAGLSCSISLSFSADGMAGPIPVTAGIEGDLDASAGVGGVLQSGGSIEVNAGGHTVGIPPAMVLIPDVSFANPHFTMTTKQFAQATAGIGLTVKAGIGVGGVGSLTLNVGSGLNFSAQPGTCLWNDDFGQFSAEGELLDWHLSTPHTPALFSQQLGGNFCASSSGPGLGTGSGGSAGGGSGGGSGSGGSGSGGSGSGGSGSGGSGSGGGSGSTGQVVTVSPVGNVDGPVGYGGAFSGPACGTASDTGLLSVYADNNLLFSYILGADVFSTSGWQQPLQDTYELDAGTYQLTFECLITDGTSQVEEWSSPGFEINLTGTARDAQAAASAPQGGSLAVMSGVAGDPCPTVDGVAPSGADYFLLPSPGNGFEGNGYDYVGYTSNLSVPSYEALLPSDLTSGETSSALVRCSYPGGASFGFVPTPFTVTAPG
jgi:hypothetical protein